MLREGLEIPTRGNCYRNVFIYYHEAAEICPWLTPLLSGLDAHHCRSHGLQLQLLFLARCHSVLVQPTQSATSSRSWEAWDGIRLNSCP